MSTISISTVVDANLESAGSSSSGHSATTVYGGRGHRLRQTVVALARGRSLSEHESPGEATLFVLSGRVRLHCASQSWEGGPDDFLVIPDARHSLEALETSAVLLTVSLASNPGS